MNDRQKFYLIFVSIFLVLIWSSVMLLDNGLFKMLAIGLGIIFLIILGVIILPLSILYVYDWLGEK